jgi:hypothetical protein
METMPSADVGAELPLGKAMPVPFASIPLNYYLAVTYEQ